MTVNIEYDRTPGLALDYEKIITEMIEASSAWEHCPYALELSVLLTDDAGIREINREMRNIDSPTDVLSFPMLNYETPSDFSHVEEEQSECFNPDTGELMLGDIVLNEDRIRSQAREYGHSELRELAFLTVHSMLHLFGYDHMEEAERLRMEERQRRILESKGIVR